MAETIATAVIDLKLDSTQFKKKLNEQQMAIKEGFSKQLGAIKQVTAQQVGAITGILDKAFAGISGAGIASVAMALKQNTIEAKTFLAVTDRLKASAAGVGEKLLNMNIGGKTATQWIDTFSRKLQDVTEKDLKKMLKALKAILAVTIALKLGNYLVDSAETFYKAALEFRKGAAEVAAAKGLGGVAAGAGAGGAIGGALSGGFPKGMKDATFSFMRRWKAAAKLGIDQSKGVSANIRELKSEAEKSFAGMKVYWKAVQLQMGASAAKKLGGRKGFTGMSAAQWQMANIALWGKKLASISKKILFSLKNFLSGWGGVLVAVVASAAIVKNIYDNSEELRKSLAFIGKGIGAVAGFISTSIGALIRTISNTFIGLGRSLGTLFGGGGFKNAFLEFGRVWQEQIEKKLLKDLEEAKAELMGLRSGAILKRVAEFAKAMSDIEYEFDEIKFGDLQSNVKGISDKYNKLTVEFDRVGRAIEYTQKQIAAELKSNKDFDANNSQLGQSLSQLKSQRGTLRTKLKGAQSEIFGMVDELSDFAKQSKDILARIEELKELQENPKIAEKSSMSTVALEGLRQAFSSGAMTFEADMLALAKEKAANDEEIKTLQKEKKALDEERNKKLDRIYKPAAEFASALQTLLQPDPTVQ